MKSIMDIGYLINRLQIHQTLVDALVGGSKPKVNNTESLFSQNHENSHNTTEPKYQYESQCQMIDEKNGCEAQSQMKSNNKNKEQYQIWEEENNNDENIKRENGVEQQTKCDNKKSGHEQQDVQYEFVEEDSEKDIDKNRNGDLSLNTGISISKKNKKQSATYEINSRENKFRTEGPSLGLRTRASKQETLQNDIKLNGRKSGSSNNKEVSVNRSSKKVNKSQLSSYSSKGKQSKLNGKHSQMQGEVRNSVRNVNKSNNGHKDKPQLKECQFRIDMKLDRPKQLSKIQGLSFSKITKPVIEINPIMVDEKQLTKYKKNHNSQKVESESPNLKKINISIEIPLIQPKKRVVVEPKKIVKPLNNSRLSKEKQTKNRVSSRTIQVESKSVQNIVAEQNQLIQVVEDQVGNKINLGFASLLQLIQYCVTEGLIGQDIFLKFSQNHTTYDSIDFLDKFSEGKLNKFDFEYSPFTLLDHRRLSEVLQNLYPTKYHIYKIKAEHNKISAFLRSLYELGPKRYFELYRTIDQLSKIKWWSQLIQNNQSQIQKAFETANKVNKRNANNMNLVGNSESKERKVAVM